MSAILRFLFPCRQASDYYARHSSLPSLREMCIGGAMVAGAAVVVLAGAALLGFDLSTWRL